MPESPGPSLEELDPMFTTLELSFASQMEGVVNQTGQELHTDNPENVGVLTDSTIEDIGGLALVAVSTEATLPTVLPQDRFHYTRLYPDTPLEVAVEEIPTPGKPDSNMRNSVLSIIRANGGPTIKAPEKSEIPQAYELRAFPVSHFIELLVENDVISKEFVDSGILDKFVPDTFDVGKGDYHGGFRHIFLGDFKGGMHDMGTLIDAGLVGGDTIVRHSLTGDRMRLRPGVETTRTHQVDTRHGVGYDSDGDGDIDVVKIKLRDAVSQFPVEWSTEEIVEHITGTYDRNIDFFSSDGKIIKQPEEEGVILVESEGDNFCIVQEYRSTDGKHLMKLRVFVDKASRKITSSYPVWSLADGVKDESK